AATCRGHVESGTGNPGERPGLAVWRDRHDDGLAERVLEAELAQPARRRGLDDDARRGSEPREQRSAFSRPEVARDPALVHVRGEPGDGTLAVLDVVEERRPQAICLAAWRLDLHDLGAEVGRLKSFSKPYGIVAAMAMPPSKRVFMPVHCLSPAVSRSSGMKVWPTPPNSGLRMSVRGFTRVVRHQMISSML